MHLPCDAGCDVVFPQVVVAMAHEVLTHVLHFTASERSAVVEPAVQHAGLAGQQLDQLPHLRGRTARVGTSPGHRSAAARLPQTAVRRQRLALASYGAALGKAGRVGVTVMPSKPHEMGTILSLTVHTRKLKHREAEQLSHVAQP